MTDLCTYGQSSECQYRAVTGIIKALHGDVILYEAFDDLWKFDPSHRQYDRYFVFPAESER
jgi:exo-beta-1,3-glucanase (GH17 family)